MVTRCLARDSGNWQNIWGETSKTRFSSGKQKLKGYFWTAREAKYRSNFPLVSPAAARSSNGLVASIITSVSWERLFTSGLQPMETGSKVFERWGLVLRPRTIGS